VKFTRWFSTPQTSPDIDKTNFVNVQIDAVGVGLASAASPFLPVFLARLGASNFQIGLLTSMPAVTGLLFAIPLGRLLQGQKKIIPWFSGTRLAVIMCYALTGLISLFVSKALAVNSILAIWALATIPQTILAITFSVVMNAVAGPAGRYELMSRRWSILGITTAGTVFLIGQLLDRVAFPLNFQLAFMALSVGGLVSFYFSNHITIPETIPPEPAKQQNVFENIKIYGQLILKEKSFVSYNIKRFVFMTGVTIATPLLPIYFVRQINASDSWIATINTAQTAVMILGYFFWTYQSRLHGSKRVILWTTFGLSIYPVAVALNQNMLLIAIFAGLTGIFQAGLDLVFFDELMKTIPPEYSAIFVSVAQSIIYLSSILAPILGTSFADWFGLSNALILAGCIRFLGFVLFSIDHFPKFFSTKQTGTNT
jgi:MFS family permease